MDVVNPSAGIDVPLLPEDPDFREPAKPPAELTRKQIGQMRRQYLTVVHGTVKNCGHKARFSATMAPNSNCIYCWEAYFMTSVDLEGVHAVITQGGVKELVKHRGKKFTKMFHGFLASRLLPALQSQLEAVPSRMQGDISVAPKIEGGTFGNTSGEVQAVGNIEQATGQVAHD